MMSLVSAADIYTANVPIDFKSGCNYNQTFCPPTTVCNVTAFYPDGGLFVENQPMTNKFSFYNKTLPITNTLGTYSGRIVCFDSVSQFSGVQDFEFQVTTTGNTGGGNMTIFILLLAVASIILIISLVLSNIYMGFLSGIVYILGGLYINIYSIGIERNMFSTGVGMAIIGLGSIIFIMCAYKGITSEEGFNIGGNKEQGDSDDIYKYEQEADND
jgi:hypothetical protein